MNYEEMSDFEINGYVSMHMHGFSWIEFVDGCASHVKCGNECSPGFAMIELSDYCNNPSDASQIITANRVNVYASEGPDFRPWMAGRDGFMVSNKNPLRAAMIVFLMMQDEAK